MLKLQEYVLSVHRAVDYQCGLLTQLHREITKHFDGEQVYLQGLAGAIARFVAAWETKGPR